MRARMLCAVLIGASGCDGGSAPPNGADARPEDPPPAGTCPMPLISRGVPAFASSSAGGAEPASSNDDSPSSTWSASTLPAWIAYDLSSVPAADREDAVVAWYAPSAPDHLIEEPEDWHHIPVDYTIEINHTGGAAPPVDGWTAVATVTNSARNGRQHVIALDGASWIRMTVSRGSDELVGFDLDVYSAPCGASDSWLMMGDSITFMALMRAFSDLPALVNAIAADRWPAVIDAAEGGTNTSTAIEIIDEMMTGYPGRYVGLAYGTNDHVDEFVMEGLVQKVIAAGKVPVVPRMIWSQDSPEGVEINEKIDALYARYPEILRGPDLWTIFEGHTEWIPAGDVHPTEEGSEVLRAAWAEVIAATGETAKR
jgi:hypothetical protein